MIKPPFPRFYRLVGKVAVPVDDFQTVFVERMLASQRSGDDPWRVAFTEINKKKSVSTVFLGIDHNFFGGEPRIFETAIFTSDDAEIINRCATWEQAEAAHEEAVLKARNFLKVVK